MRIKLTHLIIVSLISLSVVFSAISTARAGYRLGSSILENTTLASGYSTYKKIPTRSVTKYPTTSASGYSTFRFPPKIPETSDQKVLRTRPAHGGFSQIKRVIFIGVDGLGSYRGDGVDWKKPEDLPDESQIELFMPKLWKRMDSQSNGMATAWTLRLLNSKQTKSGVNWATLFSGATYSRTGIGNENNSGNDAAESGKRRVPHIFQVFKRQRYSSRVFGSSSWEGIEGLLAGEDFFKKHNRSDAFDQFKDYDEDNAISDAFVKNDIINELNGPNPASLMLAYFHQVDLQGHAHGWSSSEYDKAIKNVDMYIDQIFGSIISNNLQQETVVIIVADHGGGDLGGEVDDHGFNEINERLVPLIICGPSNIMNDGEMTSPGDDLDSYSHAENFLNIDVAMTIAAVFGLDVPEEWHGRTIREAFQGSINGLKKVSPRVEAAFNRGHIYNYSPRSYLFNGRVYVRFNYYDNDTDNGYPKRIDDFWHDRDNSYMWNSNIDAALNKGTGRGSKAYFFKGSRYVRYDLGKEKVDSGYPKMINNQYWPGLNWTHLDAALDTGRGRCYFFKGNKLKIFDWGDDKVIATYNICDVFEDFSCRRRVDAAMHRQVGYTTYAYLFSGSNYWKYKKKDYKHYVKVKGPVGITSREGGTWEGVMIRDYKDRQQIVRDHRIKYNRKTVRVMDHRR